MDTGNRIESEPAPEAGVPAGAPTEDAHLADAAMALLGCRREADVYEVICDFIVRLCPGVVVIVDEITPDLDYFITRGIAGVGVPLLSKAASIMGFEIVGKRWPILPVFRSEQLKGALVKIPGGFADLAANDIPRPIADSITKVFGVHELYIIGIADRENALGNFAIITRAPDVVLPTHIIEAFARHCYSAIANIRRVAQLAESARENALVLRNMAEGLALHEMILDEDGVACDYRFLNVNPAFADLLELRAEELIGRTALEIWPDVEPAWIEFYREVVASGDAARFESYSASLDKHFGVSAYSPQPGQFASVISDITESKLARDTLRESERWLSESQRIAGLGHYVFDIDADRWEGSPSLYGVLGVDADYVKDFAGWLNVVTPPDRERLSRYFTEDVIGRKMPFDIEYAIVRPSDGAERWVHGLGTVTFAEDGHPLEMFGVIQDITERRRTDALLAESLSSIISVVGRVVETRDPYTAGHERRVAELAVIIAEEMGMSALETENIRIAALIHDVGKVSVPAEILSKPGRLSALEFELIKSHPESGYQILFEASMDESIAEMVRQHHERCDGSGYPRGLSGGELLVGAKVLMVADTVEAMVSHRPYRPGLGTEVALAEIESGAGLICDSQVAESCLRVFRERAFSFSPA